MRIAIGLLLVFPGILLAPNIASTIFVNHGGEAQSIMHGIVVISTLVVTPWTGMRILNFS